MMFISKLAKVSIIALMVFMPVSSFAGFGLGVNGDPTPPVTTDSVSMQITSYYDLRDRESYVQVTNAFSSPVAIHVQIFQNDMPGCDELNFNDTLTGNDTHVYNLDNLVGNALPVNIDVGDDSNGFVVVTQVAAPAPGSSAVDFDQASLIGNFRIVDASGYEYRTNSAGYPDLDQLDADDVDPDLFERQQVRYTLNYNQLGGNNQADVVGIGIDEAGPGFSSVDNAFVRFETFIFNDAEGSTSCDFTNFACGESEIQGPSLGEGDFLNQGINDLFTSTNGEILVCAGNTTSSGFVDFIGDNDQGFDDENLLVGYVGLNNGNGTGSMDSWVGNTADICEFFPNGDCPLSDSGGFNGPGL